MMFSSIRSRVVRETPAEPDVEKESRAPAILKPAAEPPRALGPLEKEWKEQIHRRLLDVMDLSLIDTLPEDQARDAHPRDQPSADERRSRRRSASSSASESSNASKTR